MVSFANMGYFYSIKGIIFFLNFATVRISRTAAAQRARQARLTFSFFLVFF